MESRFHENRFQHLMWFFYARVVANVMLAFFTRRRVRGQANIPPSGPLLVVANHLSSADQYLITASITRKTVYMAKAELFRSPVIRFFVSNFGAFPVRRGSIMDRKAIQMANQILDSGLALVMFPEGMRRPNAELSRALPGSAMIALHNNVPILPVGITGMEHVDVKGPFWHMLHRPTVEVNIGRPFHLDVVEGEVKKKDMRRLVDQIMERLADLLPPRYHGYYAKERKDGRDN